MQKTKKIDFTKLEAVIKKHNKKIDASWTINIGC